MNHQKESSSLKGYCHRGKVEGGRVRGSLGSGERPPIRLVG